MTPEETSIAEEKIHAVLSHIENVQRNCNKVGLKLIRSGHISLGRNLIANGHIHDNSKFKGIEWEHLFSGSHILADVISHHNTTNAHHPEYWGGIHEMPELYVAEMVCDVTARSQEFGTGIREWIKKEATKKYKFKLTDPVGEQIIKYLDLLLEKPFEK